MRLRRTAIIIIAGAYLLAQLFDIITIHVHPAIADGVARWGGREWPRDVCYPVPYADDSAGYTAAVYAIIPAVLHPYSPDCKDYLPR
jgi:hypothetical protein